MAGTERSTGSKGSHKNKASATARKKKAAKAKSSRRPKQVPSLAPKVSARGKKAALGLEINLAYIDAIPAIRDGKIKSGATEPPPPDVTKHTDTEAAKAKWLAEQQALSDMFANMYTSGNDA